MIHIKTSLRKEFSWYVGDHLPKFIDGDTVVYLYATGTEEFYLKDNVSSLILGSLFFEYFGDDAQKVYDALIGVVEKPKQNPLEKLSMCTVCLNGKDIDRLRRVSIEISGMMREFDLCVGCCQKPINEIVMLNCNLIE